MSAAGVRIPSRAKKNVSTGSSNVQPNASSSCAEEEAQRAERDEGDGIAALVGVEPGRDELPDLEQNDRAGDENPGDEGDLQFGKKGLCDPGADQRRVACLDEKQGTGEKTKDEVSPVVRDCEADADGE